MDRTPEKQAGELAPTPAAVSIGDDVHHHYNDINAEREKEQTGYSSGSDPDEESLFQLQSSELGGSSTKPMKMPIFVDNETSIPAKQFSWKKPLPTIRYDVPDPNRIPMSVFARNTATTSQKEWSVASNESLFSIQLGNSSFSREQGMLLMGRSEDLMSGSLESHPPRVLPGRGMVEGNVKQVDVNKVKEEKTTGYPPIDSISRQSDCSSTTSFGSFAFPNIRLASEGKSESKNAISKKYADQQPPPLIHPLNAPTTASSPPLASAKMRCFPCCFCWCQLCCYD